MMLIRLGDKRPPRAKRIFENGEVELDLVRGLRLGARRKIRRRGQIEGVCRQPRIVGVLDLGDDGLRHREKPMPLIQSGAPRARHRTPCARGGVVRRRTFPELGSSSLARDRSTMGWAKATRAAVSTLGAGAPSGGGALLFAGEAECASGQVGARRHRRRVGCAPLLRCTQRRGRGAWRGDFERGGRRLLGAEHARSRQAAVTNAIAPKPAPKDRPPISIPRKPPSVFRRPPQNVSPRGVVTPHPTENPSISWHFPHAAHGLSDTRCYDRSIDPTRGTGSLMCPIGDDDTDGRCPSSPTS